MKAREAAGVEPAMGARWWNKDSSSATIAGWWRFMTRIHVKGSIGMSKMERRCITSSITSTRPLIALQDDMIPMAVTVVPSVDKASRLVFSY